MAKLKSLKIRRELGNGMTSFLIQDLESGLVYSSVYRTIQGAMAELRKYLDGVRGGGSIHCRGRMENSNEEK